MSYTYLERAGYQNNPIGKRLFHLMDEKQTNLAISADVTTKSRLLEIAELLGPKICILKTHLDIIGDADPSLISQLKSIAEKHRFLIFEDRKFADIGSTVKQQYEGGVLKISSWADMVNFHIISGPGVLQGLKSAKSKSERAFIVLSQMSSEGNHFTPEYTSSAVKLAEANPDEVIGFICMSKQNVSPQFLHFTPGVKLSDNTDVLGQQYRTPFDAIVTQGCDIIIVGRGITESENMLQAAERYRSAGWDAYLQRLQISVPSA